MATDDRLARFDAALALVWGDSRWSHLQTQWLAQFRHLVGQRAPVVIPRDTHLAIWAPMQAGKTTFTAVMSAAMLLAQRPEDAGDVCAVMPTGRQAANWMRMVRNILDRVPTAWQLVSCNMRDCQLTLRNAHGAMVRVAAMSVVDLPNDRGRGARLALMLVEEPGFMEPAALGGVLRVANWYGALVIKIARAAPELVHDGKEEVAE